MKTKNLSRAACNAIVDMIKAKANKVIKEEKAILCASEDIQRRATEAYDAYIKLPQAIREEIGYSNHTMPSRIINDFADYIVDAEYIEKDRKTMTELAAEVMLVNFRGTESLDELVKHISPFK